MSKDGYNRGTTGLLLLGLLASVVPQMYPQYSAGALFVGVSAALAALAMYILRRRQDVNRQSADPMAESVAVNSLPPSHLTAKSLLGDLEMNPPFHSPLHGGFAYQSVREAHDAAVRKLFFRAKLSALYLHTEGYGPGRPRSENSVPPGENHYRKVARTLSLSATMYTGSSRDILDELEGPKEIEVGGIRFRVGPDGVISVRESRDEQMEATKVENADAVPARHLMH